MDKEVTVRKTPIMGWASWNAFRTNISEKILKDQADALVSTGLAKKGYQYFNIDDGFFGGRDEEGHVRAHAIRFPNGMRVLSDYVHAKGLYAGIYAEAGDNTCGYYYDREEKNGFGVGLYQHEEADLRQCLVDWNYDFIKVDYCGGVRLALDEERQYTKIGRIIDQISREEKRPIVYNVCRWQFPGEWVTEIADSWRTGADIYPDFQSVVYQFDRIKPLRKYCKPGHVNDLDMLQVGNGMTPSEDAAHFAMWCMMSTPLMIGCDLTKISKELVDLLSNEDLIAINQDKACLQAFVTKEWRSQDEENQVLAEVWVKNLEQESSSKKAIAFLNRSLEEMTLKVTPNEVGLAGEWAEMQIRNLSSQSEVTGFDGKVTIPGHSCIVFRMEASGAVLVEEIAEEMATYEEKRIAWEEALSMTEKGQALLVDVRSKKEFEEFHPDKALHLFYPEMHGNCKKVLPDKEQFIILYCNTGKRSSQAARNLFYLGYPNVAYTGRFM